MPLVRCTCISAMRNDTDGASLTVLVPDPGCAHAPHRAMIDHDAFEDTAR